MACVCVRLMLGYGSNIDTLLLHKCSAVSQMTFVNLWLQLLQFQVFL